MQVLVVLFARVLLPPPSSLIYWSLSLSSSQQPLAPEIPPIPLSPELGVVLCSVTI